MPYSSCVYTFLCLFLLIIITTNSSSTPKTTLSYADHCSSFVPESSPVARASPPFVPNLSTSYVTGEDKLFLAVKPENETYYYYVGKSLELLIHSNYYKTIADGVYKVEGSLYIRSPYVYYDNQSDSGSYHRNFSVRERSIRFSLTGFWSENSRKLCMVGSAVDGIKTVDLDAVLKLNFASENPNIYTGVVSGTLESTRSVVNDPGYFDPISIFHFPELSNYSYSLVSEAAKSRSSDLQQDRLCSMSSFVLKMEYVGSRIELLSSCFLALSPIQCPGPEKKLRFMAKLQNSSYDHQGFGYESTLIGEASWDDKNNQLSGVACRLLYPANHSSNHAIGDCTMGLTLKYNSVWTLRNEPKAVGHIWSTKNVNDSGYFGKVNLTSFDHEDLPDLRYVYNDLDRAKKLCPVIKPKEKGSIYPDGHSYDMRFDMSFKSSKGEHIAWGYANPISVGNDLYDRNKKVVAMQSIETESVSGFKEISEPVRNTNIAPTDISYKISISLYKVKLINLFPKLNFSTKVPRRFVITAEGVYSAENGHLCMVGCGKLIMYGMNSTHTSTDCEILVKFKFASLSDKNGLIKGTIESTRNKSDPLRFEDMIIISDAYSFEMAKRSIWRMDFEITMVLIFNTLSCFFIGIQILHVKRNPEVLSRISLIMLVILCLGYMIPLWCLAKQTLFVSSDGWLEANEVVVRVITLVPFLLQIRLVQLVWSSKQSVANEKKSVFILLPMYILGCLIALLLNWARDRKYSLWDDLRSYVGLIIDGFLFPQILLNVFGGSAEKALARCFYVGTSAVRLTPHAYNQYRDYNYPTLDVNGTYYYANPSADFYSMAWDVLIPCGVIVLAVIVFLQQRNGGRWILPQRCLHLLMSE
ncbi:hypothetical protein CASFOL_019175 [Castilleja foliolosa]|uniref:RING-type E3 ubiquitin transferase n=1 Tax=Castilleja foliolosa TaxID=1961234 RepID=A0ABD3D3M0_9LAMI